MIGRTSTEGASSSHWTRKGCGSFKLGSFLKRREPKSEDEGRFRGGLSCNWNLDFSGKDVSGVDTSGEETKVEAGFLVAATLDA